MTDPKTPALPEPVAWQRRLRGAEVIDHGWHEITESVREHDEAHGHPHGFPYVQSEIRPLFCQAHLQEALDRADRAEKERDEWYKQNLKLQRRIAGPHEITAHVNYMENRATTAEAALDSARKVIELLQDALRPMSNAVYNDNGDMTISGCYPKSDECVNAYWAERSARQWCDANPKETPNADK